MRTILNIIRIIGIVLICLIGDLILMLSVFAAWHDGALHYGFGEALALLAGLVPAFLVLAYFRTRDRLHWVIRCIFDIGYLGTVFYWMGAPLMRAYPECGVLITAINTLAIGYYIGYRNDLRAQLKPKETVQ